MKQIHEYLFQYHKLTKEQRFFLFESAKQECSICKGKSRRPRLVIDHCHKTGYVRGVLCEQCNSWLGIYESTRRSNEEKEKHYKKIEKKYGIKKVSFQKYLNRTKFLAVPYQQLRHLQKGSKVLKCATLKTALK